MQAIKHIKTARVAPDAAAAHAYAGGGGGVAAPAPPPAPRPLMALAYGVPPTGAAGAFGVPPPGAVGVAANNLAGAVTQFAVAAMPQFAQAVAGIPAPLLLPPLPPNGSTIQVWYGDAKFPQNFYPATLIAQDITGFVTVQFTGEALPHPAPFPVAALKW